MKKHNPGYDIAPLHSSIIVLWSYNVSFLICLYWSRSSVSQLCIVGDLWVLPNLCLLRNFSIAHLSCPCQYDVTSTIYTQLNKSCSTSILFYLSLFISLCYLCPYICFWTLWVLLVSVNKHIFTASRKNSQVNSRFAHPVINQVIKCQAGGASKIVFLLALKKQLSSDSKLLLTML